MSSKNEFVHLHVHTQYSLLDGALHVKDLINKVKNEFGGKQAVAITDHGTMHGIYDFYKTALNNGVQPIIGCEVYVAPDNMRNREYDRSEDRNHHLVLLAKNNTGLRNLQIMASKAQLEGFYYKPRIDKELLSKHSAGIIGLSACLAGEIPRNIMRENYARAKEVAMEYSDILGKGDFYLEMQDNGIDEQYLVNRQIMKIADETGLPLVATNDCHYLNREDHVSHKVLMCIQYQTTINEQKMQESHSDQLWFKTPEEMFQGFSHVPEALKNTVEIAEKCQTSITTGVLHLPEYDVPEGYTVVSYLEHLARVGLRKKLAKISEKFHAEYQQRLQDELDVIIMKGFPGYYLIVWDFMNWSRENGVPVGPGRGSGAGSLVAYVLGITDIDPIRFNLLFERFLNPERMSMPDFDIDFCTEGRERVINYVRKKYGEERVAQIVTFSKIHGRSGVRDVGRVMEVPLPVVDKLAKLIPDSPGMTLNKALAADPSLEKTFLAVEHGDEILKHAKKIEGLIRSSGIHAAGIVIGDQALEEYVPLCRGKEGESVTQFEKDTLETVGLVKFDFLGLKNLTIIDAAVKNIKKYRNIDIDIANIPMDNQKAFELFCSGDTTGVFQLESEGMKNLLKKLQPSIFEDIIALVALYRPGPIGSGMLDTFVRRKHGEEKVEYDFPELEEILKETYGVIVYQEQVMQIAQKLGGYSLGAADLLRRAMGKKKQEVMDAQKTIFLNGDGDKIAGAVKLGYDEAKASALFDLIAKFAEYGFNKSHSAAYAVVSYQTAYLKANYPVEFMASLLSCELDKGEKVVTFIEECKKMGIEVLPPDINQSNNDFTVNGEIIRFGLGAIKNVGFGAIESIVNNRNENGDFKSIYELCERVDLRQANKKVMEALIKAGALDSLGKNRRQHLQVLENSLEQGQRRSKMKEQGILSLEDFLLDEDGGEEEEESYPNVEEMPENEMLTFEKEMLGFYVTNHPLARYSNLMKIYAESSEKLAEKEDQEEIIVAGMVKAVKQHISKSSGKRMAFVTLEDFYSDIDVVVFPKTYEENGKFLEIDKIIFMRGRVSIKEDKYSILAEEFFEVDEAFEKLTAGVKLKLSSVGFTNERVKELKSFVENHKGDVPLYFDIDKPGKYFIKIRAGQEFNIDPNFELLKDVEDLLGPNRIEIIKKSMEPLKKQNKWRNGKNSNQQQSYGE